MSKSEYLNVLKGTKLMGSGKLGLILQKAHPRKKMKSFGDLCFRKDEVFGDICEKDGDLRWEHKKKKKK